MAWFLFIDESGQDHRESPYEVLAGVAILDADLWDLVKELHDAETTNFGRRYSDGERELKGKAILKRKTFAKARTLPEILPNEVSALAKAVLDNGAQHGSERNIKALSLAKISYVTDVFAICENYDCKIFASLVHPAAPQTTGGGLRKDYGYLFERFFYFLEDQTTLTGFPQHGIIVFDELDKTRSHILIDQAHKYFKETAIGRHRAELIIPEPFFVHSDLTIGIQIADLVAYCLSWGFRLPTMEKPAREELAPYIAQLKRLRHRAVRSIQGKSDFEVWSVAYIDDLRTASEKL
ncbi:DUF3800 domain-containing protein [Tardiphaga alba]|uniref:DUF3800 domain-containing protein n=1 Tax=Tardiphaga alba TaxID=340268 RepID=A0ABX8A6J9_9BRAD|nr:DUF3800 domain-containing protein [Tardiphaga alba]QUS39252.1 DUF3800 domain-containing protein [Tardiphaga alba]